MADGDLAPGGACCEGLVAKPPEPPAPGLVGAALPAGVCADGVMGCCAAVDPGGVEGGDGGASRGAGVAGPDWAVPDLPGADVPGPELAEPEPEPLAPELEPVWAKAAPVAIAKASAATTVDVLKNRVIGTLRFGGHCHGLNVLDEQRYHLSMVPGAKARQCGDECSRLSEDREE